MTCTRLMVIGVYLAIVLLGLTVPGNRASAMATCTFSGGFAALRERIPEAIGDCVENERSDPATGNAEQRTTRGLLTWRKADGLVTYKDDSTTWLLRQGELFQRANADPPFPWESSVATPGEVAPSRNFRLKDTFDLPGSGKFPNSLSGSGQDSVFGYADGEYLLRWGLPHSGTQTVSGGYRYYDAGVGVDVRLVGEPQGRLALVVCRNQAQIQLSGYALGIQPAAGLVALGRFDHGTYVTLMGWQPSAAVQRGNASNHLELECSGSTITASVNGQVAAAAQDDTYSGGRVSVGVGTVSDSLTLEARFDNFAVWEAPRPAGPGHMVDDEGYAHAAAGAPIQYRHDPPSSGTHYDQASAAGVYAEPQPTGSWVHSLEHGYIVILYNCPTDCPELVSQLQRFYDTAPKSARFGAQKLIIQPYRSMQQKLAIVAWDYLDELDDFDAGRLLSFYNAYHDRGPEDVP